MAWALHQFFRLCILAVSTLFISIVYIHVRHWLNHAITEIEADHDHVFTLNLVARVFFVVIFAFVVRWIANIQTLDGWIFCALGVAAVLYPAFLGFVILSGIKPHVMSAQGTMESPYMLLMFTYVGNLVVAFLYGVVGWACLCLPKTSEPTMERQT